MQGYQKLDCNMSLKIHFLHSHLDFFPENCGAASDEHRERFHQDFNGEEISREMELCYARRLLPDFGKGCPLPWNTSDRQNEKKLHDFVLNNELYMKKTVRYSVYIVNIIPKQNKSTKHILFY